MTKIKKIVLVVTVLIPVLMVTVFFALGYWQVHRTHWCSQKENDFSKITINITKPIFFDFYEFYGVDPPGACTVGE